MDQVIRLLPREVADRIAAGEVVERPAAVVKELVENALDAGATTLDVELEEGGVRVVRVRDDGCGMSPADLALCTRSHATSKIASVEDLFRVASFGFRGEALPSIASVSELSILSRRREDELGARLEMRGDSHGGEPVPAGAPPGTTVEVRNLFFNVPARRKFLKQPRTELSHCLEAVTRLVLPETGVAVRITHDGRRVQDMGPVEDVRQRVRGFFGADTADVLLEARGEEGGDRLLALLGPPSLVKSNARRQYTFLNGRYVRDRVVAAALKEAYRGLIMPRDHPVAFLFLEVDPSEVDVNVHPTKTEVRFRRRDRVFRLVRETCRRGLEGGSTRPLWLSPGSRRDHQGAVLAADGGKRSESLQMSFRSPEAEEPVSRGPYGGAPPGGGCSGVGPAPATGEQVRFLQVHGSYILVETGDGFRIVDQHALHERKLFEELLTRARNSGSGEDQHLLVPEVVEVGKADLPLLLDRAPDLEDLGIRVEAFGATSICIRSLPVQLADVGGEQVVKTLLEVMREEGAGVGREELLRASLASLACRAAVTFNHPLPEEQIRHLLDWSWRHPEAANCPHGRPVAVAVTLRELELQFQRKR